MDEPAFPDPLFIVKAKDPKDQASADLLQKIVNHWATEDRVKDYLHDVLGIPRAGREPDYLHGRWCPRCHNSLPEGWTKSCDVCGAATSSVDLSGLLSDDPSTMSKPTYDGIPRASKGEVR